MNRNIIAISAATFLMSFGEELWKRFVPKYLEALGAPVTAVGLYGTLRDFVDGIYQYPGGWITDRYGRRRALLLFIGLAAAGYVVYMLAPSWPYVIAGLFLVMGWPSMANPTLFAVIGDALPRQQRAYGFTMQAILKRVPIAAAAWLGGLAIATWGIISGVRASLLATLVFAALTAIAASQIRLPSIPSTQPHTNAGLWALLPSQLRRLLASDILVRICEGLVDVLIVLYATNIIGVSAVQFGVLVAVQAITSMVVYVPAAKIADRIGRKPFVIVTFLFFALFPIAVVLSTGFASLAAAFVIGGLREIGEPARKAMIVDFALPEFRGRMVGLYYFARSISITPSALIGGLLWRIAPAVPFVVAGVIGVIGMLVFAATVDEQYAS